MKQLLLLTIFGATAFAQAPTPAPSPLDNLRQAIKLLEQDIPEITYPQTSPLARQVERKQKEMIEFESKLRAVTYIQAAITALEAEKQKTRVVPALPTP